MLSLKPQPYANHRLACNDGTTHAHTETCNVSLSWKKTRSAHQKHQFSWAWILSKLEKWEGPKVISRADIEWRHGVTLKWHSQQHGKGQAKKKVKTSNVSSHCSADCKADCQTDDPGCHKLSIQGAFAGVCSSQQNEPEPILCWLEWS